MEHVAGFTVSHDVSARDWQMKRNGRQWLLGKTFDSFCPLGPALVTKIGLSGPSHHCTSLLHVSHTLSYSMMSNSEVPQPPVQPSKIIKLFSLVLVSHGVFKSFLE